VRVAEQYQALEAGLPADWAEARFVLRVDDASDAGRAASLLSPFTPGSVGGQVRFSVSRHGGKPHQARRMLSRLDREGITGTLELVTASEALQEAEEPQTAWPPAAEQWDGAVAALPADWSDVHAQIEFASSDSLERGALLLGPVNPSRYGAAAGFRFRVAHTYGYGASPEMTRRCLERLDEESLGARVEILRTLSDTRPVVTQGPVWYVDGKAV
jgi:hypothetical protein